MRLAALVAGMLAPALALPCPVCGAGDRPDASLLIAGMIALPYVVAAVVVRAIRAAGDDR
jgi:hypothetical protein